MKNKILQAIKQRFHYYFSWKSFNLGFGFGKCEKWVGWEYMLSIDLAFISCWIYFNKIKYVYKVVKEGIDLEKMDKDIDEVLEKETPESLSEWLKNKRKEV